MHKAEEEAERSGLVEYNKEFRKEGKMGDPGGESLQLPCVGNI